MRLELAVRGLRGFRLGTDCRAQHVKTVGHSCTHVVLDHGGHGEMIEMIHLHLAFETFLKEEWA